MPFVDPRALLAVGAALALGGLLKGATGAGAPVIAVPVMATVFDVRLAVVVMVVPNVVTNFWQMWHFRGHSVGGTFAVLFASGGAFGAVVGTVLLANLPERVLSLTVAAMVVVYVLLRLARRDLRLPRTLATRLSMPVGVGAGMLQGAAGISAPISLTFLNAMQLERVVFISTVSTFFLAMSAVQAGTLAAYGMMTPATLALSGLAVLPLFALMPLGGWLARSISRQAFDRIVLMMLVVLAMRLAQSALAG